MNLGDFRKHISHLGDRQLVALYKMYEAAKELNTNDNLRRDMIASELYERKVLV
jgi:hypothetical protein